MTFSPVDLGPFGEEFPASPGDGSCACRAGASRLTPQTGQRRLEDRFQPIVHGVGGGGFQDPQAFFRTEPGGGHGCFQTDPTMGITSGLLQLAVDVAQAVAVVAGSTDGGRSCLELVGGQHSGYQGIVQMILAPEPHGFDQVLCMVGMIWFQLTEPTVRASMTS